MCIHSYGTQSSNKCVCVCVYVCLVYIRYSFRARASKSPGDFHYNWTSAGSLMMMVDKRQNWEYCPANWPPPPNFFCSNIVFMNRLDIKEYVLGLHCITHNKKWREEMKWNWNRINIQSKLCFEPGGEKRPWNPERILKMNLQFLSRPNSTGGPLMWLPIFAEPGSALPDQNKTCCLIHSFAGLERRRLGERGEREEGKRQVYIWQRRRKADSIPCF